MDEEDEPPLKSAVEIKMAGTEVRVEGPGEFVREELPFVLEWVDETYDLAEAGVIDDSEPRDDDDGDGDVQVVEQQGLTQFSPVPAENKSEITQVANVLNVDSDQLSEHFYIDDDGVGIQNPREIEPKYALLGYGIIRKELSGETYLDNSATKEKLIDHEMVDIDRWGSKFIYKLRQDGLIKDDPNTDRQRNKPFKITPKGFDEFAQWLENGE